MSWVIGLLWEPDGELSGERGGRGYGDWVGDFLSWCGNEVAGELGGKTLLCKVLNTPWSIHFAPPNEVVKMTIFTTRAFSGLNPSVSILIHYSATMNDTKSVIKKSKIKKFLIGSTEERS